MSKPRKKTSGHTNSCAGKQKFITEAQATAAAYRPRDFMQAYRCRKCGQFHYGHPAAKHLPK
jgi:hypothetical protein